MFPLHYGDLSNKKIQYVDFKSSTSVDSAFDFNDQRYSSSLSNKLLTADFIIIITKHETIL